MTLELVKPDTLDYYAGVIPEQDVDETGWIADDAGLCNIAPGLYEVVYHRAVFNSSAGLDPSKPRYLYSNEVGIGLLTSSSPLLGTDPEIWKSRFRAYNMVLIPRQTGVKCMMEYSIGYQPTKLITYYSSFIVAVRKIRSDSDTHSQLASVLFANGYAGSALLRAAGIT